MLELKPLRQFIVLAEELHFGRAAVRLHLTQPPLSRQLAALEAWLGVRLFERDRRTVQLTAAGQSFLADARAIVTGLEQAQQRARMAATGAVGVLDIGFTMAAAYSVVPRFARQFKAACPDVRLRLHEVVSHDLVEQVLKGAVDAAIMFPVRPQATLHQATVFTDPLVAALPRDHALARRPRLRLAQLANEGFVMASEEVAPTLRQAIESQCRAAGFTPVVEMEVQLQQTILSLVAEGAGVALVPASVQRMKVEGVAFRRLPDASTVEQVLAWSPGNRNPCLTQFLDVTGIAAPASPASGATRR